MSLELILIFVLFLGIITLAGFLFKIYLYFKNLTKSVNRGNLLEVLDKVLQVERKNTKALKVLKKEIARIDEEKLSYIQKVTVVRFNPFKEMGGDHSFVIALLDAKDNGFLVTSLHTREKTRVYVKEIVSGKSRLELSTEEKKALTKAQKSK